MAGEGGQKIAHALLECAQLRLDEDLSDERIGSQLNQLLSWKDKRNMSQVGS